MWSFTSGATWRRWKFGARSVNLWGYTRFYEVECGPFYCLIYKMSAA